MNVNELLEIRSMKAPEPTSIAKTIRPSQKTPETLTTRTIIRSRSRKTQALQGNARSKKNQIFTH